MERTNPNIISFSKPSEEDLKRLDELTLGKNSVNSISFTIGALEMLHKEIESERCKHENITCYVDNLNEFYCKNCGADITK